MVTPIGTAHIRVSKLWVWSHPRSMVHKRVPKLWVWSHPWSKACIRVPKLQVWSYPWSTAHIIIPKLWVWSHPWRVAHISSYVMGMVTSITYGIYEFLSYGHGHTHEVRHTWVPKLWVAQHVTVNPHQIGMWFHQWGIACDRSSKNYRRGHVTHTLYSL